MARDIGAPTTALESLIGLSQIYINQGDKKGAARMLSVVENHPAAEQESRQKAIEMLRELPRMGKRPSLEVLLEELA